MDIKHLNIAKTFFVNVLVVAFALIFNACEESDLTPTRKKLVEIKSSSWDYDLNRYIPYRTVKISWNSDKVSKKVYYDIYEDGTLEQAYFRKYEYSEGSISRERYDAESNYVHTDVFLLNEKGMVTDFKNFETGEIYQSMFYDSEGYLIRYFSSATSINDIFVIKDGNFETDTWTETDGGGTGNYYYYDNIQAFSQFSMITGVNNVDVFDPQMIYGRQNHKLFKSINYDYYQNNIQKEQLLEYKYEFDSEGNITHVYEERRDGVVGQDPVYRRYLYEFFYQLNP